ncbi:hypothetical protein [Ruminococcus sp.]|jgi:hypothetical protein|uniref:hypothetical protein n=1 Tax=Ruminococcus sp. TaxID=41978 RepID=UPI0025E8B2A5|nr:hypothetical protein [Ruminococcus sp.]
MKARPIALLTATATLMPVHAAEQSAAEKCAENFLEWISTVFESAQEFRNTYGATHIVDGAVCVVFEIEYDAPDPDVNYFENRYLFNATNGVRGSTKLNYYFNENDLEDNTVYVVVAITSIPADEFEVEFIDRSINSSIDTAHPHSVGHYSFKGIGRYNTIETDIYNWLPDCETEYRTTLKKYGLVSVRDNFVVFCLDSNAGTPFTLQEKSDKRSFIPNLLQLHYSIGSKWVL